MLDVRREDLLKLVHPLAPVAKAELHQASRTKGAEHDWVIQLRLHDRLPQRLRQGTQSPKKTARLREKMNASRHKHTRSTEECVGWTGGQTVGHEAQHTNLTQPSALVRHVLVRERQRERGGRERERE